MNKKTLWIHNSSPNLDETCMQVKSNSYDRVVILGQFEWDMPGLTKEFVDTLKFLGAELHLIHGSFNHTYYQERYAKLGIDINNVHFWGSYFSYHAERVLGRQGYKNASYDLNFKYPFISLNNRAHEHRCALIDELAKQDLIKEGIVTWHNFLQENPNYPFKHYNRKNKLLLDDEFNVKLDSYLIPRQYNESFLHVVAEATLTVPFLTEKTFIPILYKKPFVLLGTTNLSKYLQDLGFVLYDEIIDYSFDSIENLQDRTEKMVVNIKNLLGKDYKSLYEKLQPKIEFNYNRLITIVENGELVPEILFQCYKETKMPYFIKPFYNKRLP